MSKKTPLEILNKLKDFVLGFVKNDLDRKFVIISFKIVENALNENHFYKHMINKTCD